MSSEGSAIEGDFEVIKVKPLPWRSDEADDILKCLDNRIWEAVPLNQDVKQRIQGENSPRPQPDEELPAWLFNWQTVETIFWPGNFSNYLYKP